MSIYKSSSLAMIPSAYKDGKLYSVRPTDGSGDFTFSRGSNLAATRVASSGYIEKGRENLLLHSNTFSNASWLKANVTTTSGQSGYDGTSNAWRLDKAAASGNLQQNITQSGVSTLSVYAKAGTLNWVRFRVNTTGTTASAYYDLVNGVLGGVSGDITAKIESVASGWYRLSLTINATTAQVRIYPADGDFDLSGTSGNIIIQDAQLEQSMVATDYIETGASTAQAGILEDMPRLDYSGGATCPSLLLEPQRTNFVTDSEYFAGLYLYGSISATYGAYTNPSGNDSAYLLEATSAISRVQTLLSSGDGNSAVISIFIKGNDNVSYPALANNTGGQYTRWEFDANNVLTYYDGDAPSGDYGQEDYGNGWYRIWLKTDTINGNTNYYRFNPDNRYGVGSLYAWGFQVEKNSSYPTSYIPTHGNSVTRSADRCYLQSADVHSDNSGTMFFEVGDYDTATAPDGFRKIITANAVSASNLDNIIYFEEYAGNNTILIRKNGSTLLQTTPSYQDLRNSKIAIKWSDEGAKVFINGVLNKSYTGDASLNLQYFGHATSYSGDVLSTIAMKQRVHFPTALTDSECIKLTTIA